MVIKQANASKLKRASPNKGVEITRQLEIGLLLQQYYTNCESLIKGCGLKVSSYSRFFHYF